MSAVFFTSDTHFGHVNICRGVSKWNNKTRCRDFETVKEMNDLIIQNINEMVGHNDVLYHLGDFAFGNSKSINEYIDRIKCQNIILILGNHDMRFKNLYKERFKEVIKPPYFILSDSTKSIPFSMSHYPFTGIKFLGHIYLHGHTHCYNGRCHDRQIDVSVEGNDYKPYHIDEIIKIHKEMTL